MSTQTPEDIRLKEELNARLFPNDDLCDKCGCHQTWHGWWIEEGEVRCHNETFAINMAQVNFTDSGPGRFRLCYSGIFSLEDIPDMDRNT